MARPRRPHFAEQDRRPGAVTTTEILPDIPKPLRAVALERLRLLGFTPVRSNLWRVKSIPGGFEIDEQRRAL